MVINVVDQKVVKNIDYYAAKFAQKIVNQLVVSKAKGGAVDKKIRSAAENSVTKALGVLDEQGVYACFLYLVAKEKENCKPIVSGMLDILKQIGMPELSNENLDLCKDAQELLKHITENITKDLDTLLLAREVLEQLLVYTRYGIKARS